MAARPLTDARAARLGLAVAALVVGAQLLVGAAWSLSHDDPTELELTARCFTREMHLQVEPTVGDAIARSASGGTLTTVVEGNLVTVAVVTRAGPVPEVELDRYRVALAGGRASAERTALHREQERAASPPGAEREAADPETPADPGRLRLPGEAAEGGDMGEQSGSRKGVSTLAILLAGAALLVLLLLVVVRARR